MAPKTKEADNMNRKANDIDVDYKYLTFLIVGSKKENLKKNGYTGIYEGYWRKISRASDTMHLTRKYHI